MSIDVPKRDPNLGTPPAKGEVSLVVDADGNFGTYDEGGLFVTANIGNGPVTLLNQGTRPALVAGGLKLFAELVDGVGQLFARRQDNSVVQITPAPPVGLSVKWAADPNTPYIDTAVISDLAMFDMVMINHQSAEIVTINLPAANAANAGKHFVVTNLNDKSSNPNGNVHFVPDGSDRASQRTSAGATAVWDPSSANAVALYSDGQGQWNALGADISDFSDI